MRPEMRELELQDNIKSETTVTVNDSSAHPTSS